MPSLSEPFAQSIFSSSGTRTTIVLPSEIAAEFWRRELIRSGSVRAVREDRIVSWDRFKEHAFDLRTDRRPANRIIRGIFAEQILAENTDGPFLSRIVPRAAAAAEGFRAHLTRMLPALPRARALETSATRHPGLASLIADLSRIEQRYARFLEAFGLFEPGWLERSPAYRGGDHLLVMPELAEDYPEFARALADVPVMSVPRGDLPELRFYPDSRTELDAALGEIAALLDGGTPPEAIVLTVGDLDRLSDRVRQAAEVVDVPLSFRHGIPLSRSAAGRFFAAFTDVVRSGFSLDAVRRLLLNRAVPWTDYATNAKLVLAGARAGCLGGQAHPDPRWRRVGGSAERGLIDLLMRELPALTSARSAAALRSGLYRLLSRLIDRDRWDPEDERLVERCLEELRTLADLEATGLTVNAPYRFWMGLLAERLYVPRTNDRGVAVLPYRVGAALYPDHHVLLNMSSVTTRVSICGYPFLNEAEREEIGDSVADRTMSGLFAHAYAVSGRTVTASCSRTGWDGPALPPGDFVAAGRVVDAAGTFSPFRAWADEEQFGAPPDRIYRLQRSGSREYASALRAPSAIDLTEHPIEAPDLVAGTLRAQRHRLRTELISLSAADIDRFRACPFSYLLERPLGIREPDLDVDPDSARDIGSLYHAALEELFRGLHDSGERFDPEHTDDYHDRLLAIVREKSARGPGMVPAFVYTAMESLAERVFARLLEHDARLIADHRIEIVEEWGRRLDLEAGVYLVGRIDRVTRGADGTLTLVDYKKRSVPSGKGQSGDRKEATGVALLPEAGRAEERDRIASVQIPFYMGLLESRGERVSTAAYYSLEEGKAQLVIADGQDGTKPVMSRERMEEVMVLVDDMVRETARRLVRGDYRCAAGGAPCGGCAFRGVCRSRFVVR